MGDRVARKGADMEIEELEDKTLAEAIEDLKEAGAISEGSEVKG